MDNTFEMYITPLNIDPEKPALPISQPFIYSVYLSKLLGSYITLGEANDTWALNEGVLSEEAFLKLSYFNHQEWEDMLFNAMDKTKKGVFFLRVDPPDEWFIAGIEDPVVVLHSSHANYTPKM